MCIMIKKKNNNNSKVENSIHVFIGLRIRKRIEQYKQINKFLCHFAEESPEKQAIE